MTTPADVLLHQVSEGERWDTVANAYYGDPHAISRLVEANPHLDLLPVLPTGAIVLVPVIDDVAAADAASAEDLPPWKR